MQNEIETTETSLLVPGMNETDLVQSLVLQFLQHDGYIETARAFAEDMQSQKEALTLEPSAAGVGVNIRDDEDANNRQRRFPSTGHVHARSTDIFSRHSESHSGRGYRPRS